MNFRVWPNPLICWRTLCSVALTCSAMQGFAEDPMSEFAAATKTSVAMLIEEPWPPQFCLKRAASEPLQASVTRALDQGLPDDGVTPSPASLAMEGGESMLERWLETRRVPLLTLMETESTSVFFGLNAKGRVGVHFDGTSLLAPR